MAKEAFDKIREGLEEALEYTENLRPVIFRRADCWYSLALPADEDLAAHAELNPGTLLIEDALSGEILWQPN